MRRSGMTLVELGAVLAILEVLAFCFFPAYDQTREQARKRRSLSNIRQLALAARYYSADYSDRFPGYINIGTSTQPKYVHNCWDEQIEPYVKSHDVYSNGDTGIKSPSQQGAYNRVLTYCLNGALIAPYNNGNITVWTTPQVRQMSGLVRPANTILFAEVATRSTATGAMSNYRTVSPGSVSPIQTPAPSAINTSPQYQAGIVQWVDISPKAWVENANQGIKDYMEQYWKPDYGVARDLYGGGGCYAFCDGHVAFQKITTTTTSGQVLSPEKNWSPTAQATTIQFNQWYPG